MVGDSEVRRHPVRPDHGNPSGAKPLTATQQIAQSAPYRAGKKATAAAVFEVTRPTSGLLPVVVSIAVVLLISILMEYAK